VGQLRDYMVMRTTALGQPIYSDENDHAIVAWMLSILAATMEFSDMVRQNRSISIGIAGKFGERTNSEFVIGKSKIEEERRNRSKVTPRWFGKTMFSETTARNALDFMRSRSKKIEGKKVSSTVGDLKRIRGSSRREGRSTF
jgi:hypothetical protein